MKITEQILKKILVSPGLISEKDFDLIKKKALAEKKSLIDAILDQGLIFDEQLGRLIADEIQFPFVNLQKIKIKKDILNIVPEIVARQQEAIDFSKAIASCWRALYYTENIKK